MHAENESYTFIPTKGNYLLTDWFFLPISEYFPQRTALNMIFITAVYSFSFFSFYSRMHFSAAHPPTMCLPALPASFLPHRFFNLQSQIRLQISRLIPLIARKSPRPRTDPALHMAATQWILNPKRRCDGNLLANTPDPLLRFVPASFSAFPALGAGRANGLRGDIISKEKVGILPANKCVPTCGVHHNCHSAFKPSDRLPTALRGLCSSLLWAQVC